MINAKEMCQIAMTSNVNPYLQEIESKLKESAQNNCFFVDLFELNNDELNSEPEMIIVNRYDVNTFRTLKHLGYVFAIADKEGRKRLFIGFGYTNRAELYSDIVRDIKKYVKE